jgi:IS30 family transposase
MELLARGWTTAAARRDVGVSRTCGANCSPGFKVYRRGEVVRIVKPLDRLAVKTINPRYLSQEERIEIAELRHAGLSIRQVAQQIGRAPSTVSRELRRVPAAGDSRYRPFKAHRHAIGSRARHTSDASTPTRSCVRWSVNFSPAVKPAADLPAPAPVIP